MAALILFMTFLYKDYVDFSDYTAASVRKMAGNGMNIPCAGFTLLMAVLCIDAK